MKYLLILLFIPLSVFSQNENTIIRIDGETDPVYARDSANIAHMEDIELTGADEIATANQINDSINALDDVVRTGEVDPVFAADSAKIVHWADTTTKIASQYDLGGITNLRGDLTVPGDLYITPPYSNMSFKDSARVITGGTNVQITNPGDSLWRCTSTTGLGFFGITYKKGDTIVIADKGYYNMFVNVRGYGGNGADWHFNMATKKIGASVVYANNVGEFTTTGAINKNGAFTMFVREFDVGEKVWFVLSRTAGSGDFTITSSTVKFQQYIKR